MVSKDTFTASVPMEIEEHEDYQKWTNNTDNNKLMKIEATREKIENEGLITSVKSLENGLYERKWKNGLRLYFSVVEKEDGRKTLLLLGSGKDREQAKSITRAIKLLEKYTVVMENIKYDQTK